MIGGADEDIAHDAMASTAAVNGRLRSGIARAVRDGPAGWTNHRDAPVQPVNRCGMHRGRRPATTGPSSRRGIALEPRNTGCTDDSNTVARPRQDAERSDGHSADKRHKQALQAPPHRTAAGGKRWNVNHAPAGQPVSPNEAVVGPFHNREEFFAGSESRSTSERG